MGITIFAARKELPVSGPSPILGKSFSTSAGNFITICEILDLPNRVNEFDPEMVIQACDAALLNLDSILCRLKIDLADRDSHVREIWSAP